VVVDRELPNGSNDAEIKIDRTAAEELDYVYFANKVRARERRGVPSAPLERDRERVGSWIGSGESATVAGSERNNGIWNGSNEKSG
jgi:hypothetical protein